MHVSHRDTQLIIYLLPEAHPTHDTLSLHNDLLLQRPPAHWASSRGALTLKRHQSIGGISKATGALRLDSSRRLSLSSLARLRVKQASGENAATQHEDKMEVGGSEGSVTWSLHYISVHSWVGQEERAKKASCLTSFHSLSSLSLRPL